MRRTGTGAGSGADPELEAPATFWGESRGADAPVLWALACERRERERERIRSWKLRPHSGENPGGGCSRSVGARLRAPGSGIVLQILRF